MVCSYKVYTLAVVILHLIIFQFLDNKTKYDILVLASLDRVVDLLTVHEGSVKLLMWNYDGTMLGK